MLAIALLVLATIVGTTIWVGERVQTYSQDVIAARNVKSLAVELRTSLQTAESSQRGYLYTGNQVYLAPYEQAKSLALAAIERLPGDLASYSELTPAVERLVEVVRNKIADLDQGISLKQARQEDQALSLTLTNRGKLLMDEANVFLSGIGLAVDKRVQALVDEQTRNAMLLRLLSIVGGVAIVAVLGIAILLVARYTRELRSARDAVSRSNEQLEQRVAERTADLGKANESMREAKERAEILLSEVNHRVANSLTLVTSLIGMQARSLGYDTSRRALEEAQARVQAVAMVHRRLYESSDVRTVELDEYLKGLLDQFRASVDTDHGVTLHYQLEPLTLKTDASINLGVIVSEWVLNAIKYAYPDRKGEVRIVLSRREDDFALLRVEDDGVGREDGAPVKGTGVGSRIVSAMAASLGGTVEYRSNNPGLAATLAFPLG